MTTNTQLNTSGTIITVAKGGTGVSTMTTAYAPVCAGTTATGALQVASTGLSTSGNVLISNGSSSLPSFQAFPNPITKTSLTLTTTNIRGMYAAPVQIIAAQGAHTLIVVYNIVFEYIFTTSAFAGGDVSLGFGPLVQYANTVHGGGVYAGISYMNITSLAASSVFYGGPSDGNAVGSSSTSTGISQMINKGLFATNIDAAYTGGGGSMRITVYYSVFSTTV